MEYTRPEHNIIAELLAEMNHGFLLDSKCYFGGGTAIVLSLDEYRQSLDVDFLCADVDGYRELRNAFFESGIRALFPDGVKALRDVQADANSVRMLLEFQGQRIKFEIVREARITLEGAEHPSLKVPTLSVTDMFAEKLLANADRCYDRAVAYRDAIDLGHLVDANGEIPQESVVKAERAYGPDIRRKMAAVLNLLLDRKEVRHATTVLDMDYERTLAILEGLRQAARMTWPDAGIHEDLAGDTTLSFDF